MRINIICKTEKSDFKTFLKSLFSVFVLVKSVPI